MTTSNVIGVAPPDKFCDGCFDWWLVLWLLLRACKPSWCGSSCMCNPFPVAFNIYQSLETLSSPASIKSLICLLQLVSPSINQTCRRTEQENLIQCHYMKELYNCHCTRNVASYFFWGEKNSSLKIGKLGIEVYHWEEKACTIFSEGNVTIFLRYNAVWLVLDGPLQVWLLLW